MAIILQEDNSFDSVELDELGRKNLVTLIVNAINARSVFSHASLTFGIYGAWGEGKTTTMKMVMRELQQNKEIRTMWLNPWSFTGTDRIISDFFTQLLYCCEDQNIAHSIAALGNALLSSNKSEFDIPLRATYQNKLERCFPFDTNNIQDIKTEISKRLKEKQIQIVVFIDDVDRLDADEIQNVFRLIRQVLDLDNIIYVLGMDPDAVSLALGKLYGEHGYVRGHDFIGKIVNVPIVLPPVQKTLLEDVIKKYLNELLKENRTSLDKEQIDIVVKTLPLVLKTKRAIIRYFNQLSLVFPTIWQEVELADLCLLESLKYLNEKGWVAIYRDQDAFLRITEFFPDEEFSKKEEQKRYDEALVKVLEYYPEECKSYVMKILKEHLFTKIHHYHTTDASKCLSSPIYFLQYFISAVPSEIISREDALEFTARLKKGVQPSIDWVNEKLSVYSSNEVERVIRLVFDLISDKDKSELAALVIEVSSMSNLAEGYGVTTVYNPTSIDILIYAFIIPRYMVHISQEGIRELDEYRETAALSTVFSKAPLNFCMCLFNGVFSDSSISPNSSDARILFNIIRLRLIEKGQLSIFEYCPIIKRTFFTTWKLYDEDRFIQYWKDLLLNSNEFDFGRVVYDWLSAISVTERLAETAYISDLLAPVSEELKENINKSKYLGNDIVMIFVRNSSIFKNTVNQPLG